MSLPLLGETGLIYYDKEKILVNFDNKKLYVKIEQTTKDDVDTISIFTYTLHMHIIIIPIHIISNQSYPLSY